MERLCVSEVMVSENESDEGKLIWKDDRELSTLPGPPDPKQETRNIGR